MNPIIDQIVVFGAIGAALGFFAWRAIRARRRKDGCDAGCGCGSLKKVNPAIKPR